MTRSPIELPWTAKKDSYCKKRQQKGHKTLSKKYRRYVDIAMRYRHLQDIVKMIRLSLSQNISDRYSHTPDHDITLFRLFSLSVEN